ncbi:MAG: LPXTG cell wall anchor domain-containing protein [Clostridia bacterium]|nr:LPXTG cell wall anchor domain-containing protein [Clostridia bacterium]
MLSEVARNVEGNRYRQYWVTGQDENTWQIRVWNNPGVALPSTGGMGSYSYYAVGTLLLTFAAFVYLRRRRNGEIV